MAAKVNEPHFDDEAGTAKCVFAAGALGRCNDEVLERKKDGTPQLQRQRETPARAHLLNGPALLTLPPTSPPTLRPSTLAK